MYFPVQAKAALFLLASSFFGGFFVATKINQYMFEKSKGKGGGGQENDREGNEGKKKKGQIAQEEKEEKEGQEGDGQEEEEQGEEGDGEGLKSGSELKGRAAMRFLAGKSVRRNPGPNEPYYAYYVSRGVMGEGTAPRFVVRTWFLRKGELCVTNGQGVADCMAFRIVTGVPVEGAGDVELSPVQIKKIVEQADWKAKMARQKARAAARKEAEAKGLPYKETGEPEDMTLVDIQDPAMRPPTNGEAVGLMIIGDRALPILKGNLINFPAYVPTVDDPRLSKTAELAQGAPEEKKPEPPKPAPAKPPKSDRQAKGFAPPSAKATTFEAPRTADRNSIRKTPAQEEPKAANSAVPVMTGAEAWTRMLAKPLAPAGAQPGRAQPFLGYLDSEGRFMQLVRQGTAPFEVTITMANWAWRDERLCVSGLQEGPSAPTPAKRGAEKPPVRMVERHATTCFTPSLTGEATNLLNFRNEKLTIVGPEFLNPPPPPVLEQYGPYRPAAFTGVAAGAAAGGGVAALAAAASGKIAPVVSKQKGEGVTPVVAKTGAEGVKPLEVRSGGTGIAPVVSRATGGEIAPVVSRPKGDGIAPVVSRSAAGGIAPVVAKPKGEGIAPLAPRQNGGKITPIRGEDQPTGKTRI